MYPDSLSLFSFYDLTPFYFVLSIERSLLLPSHDPRLRTLTGRHTWTPGFSPRSSFLSWVNKQKTYLTFSILGLIKTSTRKETGIFIVVLIDLLVVPTSTSFLACACGFPAGDQNGSVPDSTPLGETQVGLA